MRVEVSVRGPKIHERPATKRTLRAQIANDATDVDVNVLL